jgi:hypothetical protein
MTMGRSSGCRLIAGAVLAAVGAVGAVGVPLARAGATPAGAPPPGRTVVVYGDSIVHAAAPFVRLALARYGVTVIDASVGGTAPCDALQFVGTDMARYDPAAVVIAYVGNAFTPCINGTIGENIYARHYLDTQRLVEAVGHRSVILDTPPGAIGQGHYTAYDVLVHTEASTFGVHLVDTAAALIDPSTQRFGKSMPCMVVTICRRIDVRGDDGYHLTAAGAYLYAQVLSRALVRRLHLMAPV